MSTNAWANAIPVEKNSSTQHDKTPSTKKQLLKKHKSKQTFLKNKQLKKVQQTQDKKPFNWILFSIIAWYVISIALLIIGLVIAFPPLWIAAIVLLCLPIAVAIIVGIIFLITLLTSGWGE